MEVNRVTSQLTLLSEVLDFYAFNLLHNSGCVHHPEMSAMVFIFIKTTLKDDVTREESHLYCKVAALQKSCWTPNRSIELNQDVPVSLVIVGNVCDVIDFMPVPLLRVRSDLRTDYPLVRRRAAILSTSLTAPDN
jgi:hypothetical protein